MTVSSSRKAALNAGKKASKEASESMSAKDRGNQEADGESSHAR